MLEIRRRVQLGRFRQIQEANAGQHTPRIKMTITPWTTDEQGNRSRMIFAR